MVPLALVPNLVTRGRHLHKYQAGEVTQVMESIPWVRCASGNVFNENLFACSISCIIMPRSLESRLGSAQYIDIKSKVGFCFSISCAAIYKQTGFKKSSLLQFFAAEHIVGHTSLLST